MSNDLMNLTEFAAHVGYSRQTIYTDIKEGILIPTARRGNSFLFSYAIVDEYLARKHKGAWETFYTSNNTHNGGVGKTWMLAMLMGFLAEEGYRILGIDNDAQGHLSRYFLSQDEVPNFIWEVYQQEKIEEYMIRRTAHQHIDIISATLEFAEKEDEIQSKRFREKILKRAIDNSKKLLSQYHFVFIDNHPALGVVQFNSMMAADGVLVVNDCRKISKNSPDGVFGSVNHASSQVIGIIMNRYKARSNETNEALVYAQQKYGDQLFQTVIPEWENLSYDDKFSTQNEDGFPIITHPYFVGEKKSRDKIRALGKEFLGRVKQLRRPSTPYGLSA